MWSKTNKTFKYVFAYCDLRPINVIFRKYLKQLCLWIAYNLLPTKINYLFIQCK